MLDKYIRSNLISFYWRCFLQFLWFIEITCVKYQAFVTAVLNSQFKLSRFMWISAYKIDSSENHLYQTVLFPIGSVSNVLHQDVNLLLNLINLPQPATPAPCDDGSGTVCPVRAGDFCRYTAVVTFEEDLPPVRRILSLSKFKRQLWNIINQYENAKERAAAH